VSCARHWTPCGYMDGFRNGDAMGQER
jgi:hypothetical protein